MKKEKSEGENAESLWETGGPFGDAEEREADGHRPIWKGRLFKVADAVFVERDPVVESDHLAAGFCVGAVSVVEEGWMKHARNEDGEPEKKNCEIGRPMAAGRDAHARTYSETRLDRVSLSA